MSEAEVIKMVRRDVKKAGSLRAFGNLVGVSAAYLHDILHGRRHPGPAIAKHYGLRLVTRYITTRTYKEAP